MYLAIRGCGHCYLLLFDPRGLVGLVMVLFGVVGEKKGGRP